MGRRGFICSLALGTLMVPRAASAQPPRKIYRIEILGNNSATADMVGPQTRSPGVNALLQRLRELGYVYGENFVTEPRGGEGTPERFANLAAELVRLQVDVIVAGGGMLYALKQITSTIPVVMIGVADPVGEGFARSLANPGGNFTGFSFQGVEIARKRLELLKDLVPGPRRWQFSGTGRTFRAGTLSKQRRESRAGS